MDSQKKAMYLLVFEYYETSILFGYYAYGDKLPSIMKMSRKFNMAPDTVRSAIDLLQKKGYVETSAKKTAKVIYRSNDESVQKLAKTYLASHKAGFIDLFKSQPLIFDQLINNAIQNIDEDTELVLESLLAEAPEDPFRIPILFYFYLLRSFQNDLILNLYWEMVRYTRFAYLRSNDEETADLKNCLKDAHLRTLEALKERNPDKISKSFLTTSEDIVPWVKKGNNFYDLKAAEQIPFQWNIYRQRPQICYSLTSYLIKEIANEHYHPKSFLPSLTKFSEDYDISISTARRTMKNLNDLGLTESIHGKGTCVRKAMGKINFENSEILVGLHYYLDSLQILTLTIREVFLFTLRSSDQQSVKTLLQEFRQLLDQGKSYYAFNHGLQFISKNCPLASVREIYLKLDDLLIWGYPYARLRQKNRSLNEAYRSIIQNAAEDLRTGDLEAFARGWELLMKHESEQVSEMLRMKGKEQ